MMPVAAELTQVPIEKDSLLTIGVFDGVHLGHQYLLARLTEQARQQNLLSGVVTFRQHPQEILSPPVKLPYLTSPETKDNLIKKAGVDIVIVLSFTEELAHLSARQFVSLLKKYLRMRGLVIGADFALGEKRQGDANTLRQLGQKMNFEVTVIPPLKIKGSVVSSTAIRQALAIGDMKQVTRLTGRPFSLQGQVTSGAGRGSKLGFPTANLTIDPKQILPAEGVYASRSFLNGQAYPSLTNIGRNPTFGGQELTVETHLLNYQGNLYRDELQIEIIERLRAEKQFATIEALKRQISRDIKQGIAILDASGKD